MEDYPRTIMEFENRFAGEEACMDYLIALRWPEGFLCPACQTTVAWRTARGLFHCKECGLQTSVTAGTVFQDTRKPLHVWFQAMWYVTNQKHGVSALGLQRALGLGSYRTAWTCLYKLRHAMVRPARDRLEGTIEVDETYIGGEKPGKRGRGARGKTLVLIAAQEDGKRIGRIRLQRISNASSDSLVRAVQTCVEPGSVIRTDGWSGYNPLPELGYHHHVARQDSHVGENLLPLVNRVASLLKRWLLGTHQGAVRASHLDYYLDEFTFRFNRRRSRSRGKLFYRLLQQAVAVDPLPGHRITPVRILM
jgi:transposase-like protein